MKQRVANRKHALLSALAFALWLVGCASKAPAPDHTPAITPEHTVQGAPTPGKPASVNRYEGAGHNYANAIQLADASNPLAFSQKQQEWLWLHYRDWKKQGQALREKDGVRYDEVSLVNQKGETRLIYFRMPERQKP